MVVVIVAIEFLLLFWVCFTILFYFCLVSIFITVALHDHLQALHKMIQIEKF